jgi:hypothetical protein
MAGALRVFRFSMVACISDLPAMGWRICALMPRTGGSPFDGAIRAPALEYGIRTAESS